MWLLLGLLACDDTVFGDGTTITTDPDATGWCAVRQALPSCTACHSAANPSGDLDLETDPHGAMVDVISPAYGVPLVVPGDADGSLLIAKLEGTQAADRGGPMPPIGLLDADLVARIRAWVDEGADEVCDQTLPTTPQGYHPEGWDAPDVHGMAAKFQTEADCRGCHGAALEGDLGPSCTSCHGEGWETTCTFCHGGVDSPTGAPPEDIDDNTDVALSPYQPHTVHLSEGEHATIACEACHTVPDSALASGHLFDDDTPGQAEVVFTGIAAGGTWNGATCTVYCHGTDGQPGTVDHTDDPRTCDDCHGYATRGAWEGMSGDHEKHLDEGIHCSECHVGSIDAAGRLLEPSTHVDGIVDVQLPIQRDAAGCTGVCHGETHNGRAW